MTLTRPTLAAIAALSVPFALSADPSDVDQFGNPVGYLEMTNAPVTGENFAYAALDMAMELEAKLGAVNRGRYRRLRDGQTTVDGLEAAGVGRG